MRPLLDVHVPHRQQEARPLRLREVRLFEELAAAQKSPASLARLPAAKRSSARPAGVSAFLPAAAASVSAASAARRGRSSTCAVAAAAARRRRRAATAAALVAATRLSGGGRRLRRVSLGVS